MSDEEIRRLERAYRADPTQENANVLGRARARITPGIEPTEDPAVFVAAGLQLVHVPDLSLFAGRFPVTWLNIYGVCGYQGYEPHTPAVLGHDECVQFCAAQGSRLLTADEWAHVALGPIRECRSCDGSGFGDEGTPLQHRCWTCNGNGTGRRRHPWGRKPVHEDRAVWSGYPWRTQRVMTSTGRWILPPGDPAVQVGQLVGVGSNGLPEVIRGDVVGDSFVGIVRAVNEDGTVDIETQRTPELVRTPLPCLVLDPECVATGCDNRDGHQQLVPARPSSASWCGALDLWHVRERVTVNGEPRVIGGSFRTSTWSAEPTRSPHAEGTFRMDFDGRSYLEDESDVGFRVCFDVGGRKG